MKKKLIGGLLLLLALLFILMPLPASDLFIRIYFDDIAGDSCSLYYATDAEKTLLPDQYILSPIDGNDLEMWVEFRLDGALEDQLTSLRLDWPHEEEQLICVKNISISSGGVIQKSYNPCYFFADGNVIASHETSVTLVHPTDRVYLLTGSDDPFQVLSDGLVEEIRGHYSHRVFSRIFLCVFVAGCWFFARKKLFD